VAASTVAALAAAAVFEVSSVGAQSDTEATVAFTSPAPSTLVASVVQLNAVVGEDTQSLTFEVSLDRGASWSLIAVDSVAADGFSASWDSRPYSGGVLLRAVAPTGASAVIAVYADNAAPRASLRPARRHTGTAAQSPLRGVIRATEPVSVRLAASRAGGAPVRIPVRRIGPKSFTFAWTSVPRRTPDGRYRLVAELRDRVGNRAQAVAEVVVDNKPPKVSLVAADITRRGTLLVVRLRSADASGIASVEVRARAVNDSREVLAVRSRPGLRNTTLQWHASIDAPLRPGAYAVRARATDVVGNTATTHDVRLLVRHPVRTQVVARVLGAGRKVALTFDDCASGWVWDSILRTLMREQVRAAFFCPGQTVLAFRDSAARTLRDGHTVGSHGWDHANLAATPFTSALTRLIDDSMVWWRGYRASATPYFRPPYGSYNSTTLAAASSAGYSATVLWDVDPLDWTSPGAGVIAHRVLTRSRPGSVILLHVVPQTAAALSGIISGLRSRQLEPVGLDELLWSPHAVRTAGGWPR